MKMYESWLDEDLIKRYKDISQEFLLISEEMRPKILKISKIEKEIYLLIEEIGKRGIDVDEKESG